MRTLTKTGIRMLSAKYRSILIKCAIINASLFIGMVGAGSAIAEDMTWSQLKNDIDNAELKTTIEIPNSITRDVASPDGDITISKELSIVGSKTDSYLSGDNNYKGLKINEGGILTLQNITMQNFNNTYDGGAIYNDTDGIIESITGDFIGNTTGTAGGAIVNYGTIKGITGNFKYNSAKDSSGAIYNHQDKEINFVTKEGDITFDGNYVTSETGKGGAIYNYRGTVGLYADAGRSITFTGNTANIPDEDKDNATDVDGICNIGILNINGDGNSAPYAGTVNLQNITNNISSVILGTTNIYGGTVNVKDTFIQEDLNLNAGTLNLGKGGTVTNLNANGGALSMSIPYGTFDNYTNEISTLTVDNFTGTLNNFTVDYNANSGMDKISVGTGNNGTIHLTAVNVLSNAQPAPDTIATYLTGEGKGSITTTETGSITSAIDGYTYTFTFDGAGKGNVLVTMTANGMDLPTAIQTDDKTITGYSAQLNPVIVYEDLGTLAGENRNFTIFGNGSTIDGNGKQGISVEDGQTFAIKNATMKNFKSNYNGGAISNNGTITSITGVDDGTDEHNIIAFSNNSAQQGGAIYNPKNSNIDNIQGDFKSNSTTGSYGGAIHNSGTITSITGNFISNKANGGGGAIYNTGEITKISGNFTNNSTKNYGGALYNANLNGTVNFVAEGRNITFDGNYVTAKNGQGGAIYNFDTVGLYAVNAGDKIEFTGIAPAEIPTGVTPIDIDGIYNDSRAGKGILNINGYIPDGETTPVTYAGTVNLQNVAGTGTTNIYGGTVHFGGDYSQNATNIYGGTLNFANNKINTANLGVLNLVGNANLMLDADLAGEGKMDQLNVTSVSGDGNIVISDIKLLSDAIKDEVSLSLFADGTPEYVYGKVSGKLSGLQYSSIYKYDANYDKTDGKITFTRYNSGTSDDFNPYLYAPSGVANATATMTTQIAALAMDKMDDAVHAHGRSGGDTTTSSNAWVKVMGLNDNVEFNNFENIDSKTLTVAAGYNTDKITCGNCGIVLGAYAGYIGGKQQYTGNDIDQNGGYVGLSSALTLGDAFLTATVNGGLLNNKANNMYGTDRFNTRWLGAGLKTGYNYAITDSVVLQPDVYGGYTLVNTQDYTSVSGVKIATNNLNFFEIDPGLKLSAVIADGWTTSVQGKYAIVMDNGADITVNDIALQNISTKNYFEYGIGIDKSLTDAFYLGAKINRHDGGRTGWNGSIEFRYKF